VSAINDAIGTIFACHGNYMKMYFEYINNFDDALQIVEQWEKHPEGSRYLSYRQEDTRHSQLNLLGYLLLPIQRIPRYRLLLEGILHSTNSPSSRLRDGYDKIVDLASEINARKAEVEGRKRLVQLDRMVARPLSPKTTDGVLKGASSFVDPARRLLKEGHLQLMLLRQVAGGHVKQEFRLGHRCLALCCSDKIFLVNLPAVVEFDFSAYVAERTLAENANILS
jgi:RhoGEF domain